MESWSGFRGGGRQGVASGTFPVQWNTQSNVRWKVRVPGRGSSSPVVSGNRIVLTTESGSEGGRELSLVCVHRGTGKLLWQSVVGKTRTATHSKNDGASATPACDDQRVFASFGSLGLFCFDWDGNQLWHARLDYAEHPWGSASSPVVAGPLVFQVCDGPSGSFLVALEAETGREVWRTERDSCGSWSTPVVYQALTEDGPRWEVLVNGTGTSDGSAGCVIAYDPTTGRELWQVRGTTDIPCPTAIVTENFVISTSGGNGPVLAIRPGGSGDVSHSHVAWRLPNEGAYVPTGVAVGDRLYLISDAGVLSCRRLSDGGLVWEQRLGGTFTASLVASGDCVYAVSERGLVHVVEAADAFRPLGVNRMNQRCLATPALAGGELYLRTDEYLYCISGDSRDEAVSITENLPASAGREASVSRAAPMASDAPPPASNENATHAR